MARGRGQQARSAGDDANSEVHVCPLCIEPLDADEQQFYPCPCGYQVCVFCHKKIELFCNNLCPGCRTEYGSQKAFFDPASRLSSNDVTHSAPPVPLPPAKNVLSQSAEASTPQSALAPKANGLQQGATGWPSLWGPSAGDKSSNSVTSTLASQAPAEVTSAWPSLAASQRQVQGASTHPASPSQPLLLQQQADNYASAWSDQQSDQQQEQASTSSGADRTRVTLAAPLTAGQVPSVQADPDGAALLQKVQSAVGNGELSIEEGTKQLVAFLRQREQTGKGKPLAGAHVPKPPPGFAAASTAPPSSAGRPQLPSRPPDTVSSDTSSLSTSFSPFPAMQPSSSSNPFPSVSVLSSGQSQPGVSPQWSAASAAPSFQQWNYPPGTDNHTLSSQSSLNSSSTTAPASTSMASTASMFPVDLVAASAALWAAPAAGSNQLQSLSSLGFSQPLMPRKRRGPLYARTGQVSGKGTSSPQTPESGKAESKGLQQQTQWQTLGNGIFGDHLANSPQGRNSFSTNGLQSSMFAGVQSASLDANGQPLQLQEYTNGLHSGS